MNERDKILKTLRDVPGVRERWNGVFFSDEDRKAIVFADGKILIQNDNATLAEAVAALTPTAEPRKPTYQFVSLLKGAETRVFGRSVTFRNTNGTSVTIYFDEEYRISMCLFGNLQLATPQTEAEVLATLRVCDVEVEG